MDRPKASDSIFRVARMIVPVGSKDDYLSGLLQTHGFIGNLEGLGTELLLEGPETDGFVQVLTIAEWRDQASFSRALEAVRGRHAEIDYRIEDRLKRLGVSAEIANFRAIAR